MTAPETAVIQDDTGHQKAPRVMLAQLTPLLLDAEGIVESGLVPTSLRTWRRWDSAGRIPAGFFIGQGAAGCKFWRVADIQTWVAWGMPTRTEFEARLKATDEKTRAS